MSRRLIITCFDGKRLFDLLKHGNINLPPNDPKFSIKKEYDSDVFKTGLKISVIHPFSNREYYTEYLVDLHRIAMEFKKHGYLVVKSGQFTDFLDEFKQHMPDWYDQLDSADKTYSGYYNYLILEKNSQSKKSNTGKK